ncbi:hypothetical protein PIB30_083826, partial [Stylosanthes scabra]|nr:hypothetical protein [Stylosanthes scabra]
SEDEMDGLQRHPYTSHVRGVQIDFSLSAIRRVMRFKEDTRGAENNYDHRQKYDQQLDEQSNKSEITVARAILIHSIIRGEDVRAEELIADNIVIIAQGLGGNCKLGFLSTIYKLCKEAGVRMREFRNMEELDEGRYITTEVMETVRVPRIFLPIIDNEERDDEPMPQYVPKNEAGNADVGNKEQEQHQHFEHHFEQPPPHFEQPPPQFQQQQPQYVTYADFQQFQQSQMEQMQQYQQNQLELQQQGFQKLNEQIANMQIGIQNAQGKYIEEVQALKQKQQDLYTNYNNFYNYMKKEQQTIVKEIDEVKRFQVGQTLMAGRTDAIDKLTRPIWWGCFRSL